MDCQIVYLKPVGAGGYKAELRSDTLWGALCWAIRSVFDEARLERVLSAYASDDADEAFYLSSAFPYLEDETGKTCFFPMPMQPFRHTVKEATASLTPTQIKLRERKKKSKEQGQQYLSKPHFEYLIGDGEPPLAVKKAPPVINRPMTHNTISRLTGSTLTIKEKEEDAQGSGQLFHTEELYLKGEDSGLFFLLRGNDEVVTPALRYLQHEGIGGDRSTGKGRFDISDPMPFTLNTPADANALVCLSLYHPTSDELAGWPGAEARLMNYKLETRQGRAHLRKQHLHEKALLFFKEGSAFPSYEAQATKGLNYGQNVRTGRHSAGFDMQRYGHGFMINAKIR